MGPCRLTKEGSVGVCGATIDTIQARNLVRAIAAGSAAHSDHGRDMAFTLKAVANDEASGYYIRDVAKLRMVAARYTIPIEGRSPKEIANDRRLTFPSLAAAQRDRPDHRAPSDKLAVNRRIPRGIDRSRQGAPHPRRR
jgi:carbon-monoxide dehydrogenase catalytic subunit